MSLIKIHTVLSAITEVSPSLGPPIPNRNCLLVRNNWFFSSNLQWELEPNWPGNPNHTKRLKFPRDSPQTYNFPPNLKPFFTLGPFSGPNEQLGFFWRFWIDISIKRVSNEAHFGIHVELRYGIQVWNWGVELLNPGLGAVIVVLHIPGRLWGSLQFCSQRHLHHLELKIIFPGKRVYQSWNPTSSQTNLGLNLEVGRRACIGVCDI